MAAPKIQQAKAGYRVSTGPVRFDGDWPGYFFRGDETPEDTINYACMLLEGRQDKNEMFGGKPAWLNATNALKRLINQFNECQIK